MCPRTLCMNVGSAAGQAVAGVAQPRECGTPDAQLYSSSGAVSPPASPVEKLQFFGVAGIRLSKLHHVGVQNPTGASLAA